MKKCKLCKVEKELSCFYKRGSSGFAGKCKVCISEARKVYGKNNKEKIKARKKAYHIKNKDKISEKKKVYRKNNKEKIKDRKKAYHIKNKDKICAKVKIWSDDPINKAKKAARAKITNPIYRKKNKEKYKEYDRKRRAMKSLVVECYTKEDELVTRALFNNLCFNCGSAEDICIDHNYPLCKGNALTLQNAVLLCNSCNCSKGPKNPEDFYTEEQQIKLKKKLKGDTNG